MFILRGVRILFGTVMLSVAWFAVLVFIGFCIWCLSHLLFGQPVNWGSYFLIAAVLTTVAFVTVEGDIYRNKEESFLLNVGMFLPMVSIWILFFTGYWVNIINFLHLR
jgi:hypothetical protein